jgi:type I restriction enzyme S subunit
MSFRIGPSLDAEKAFLVRRSVTAGRLDPEFHRPYYRRRHAELNNSAFPVLPIGNLKGRIFQGVGRNLVEGAPARLLKVKNITPDGQIDFSDTEPVANVPKSKLLQSGDIISPFIGAAIKGYKFAKFGGSEQPYAVDNNTGVIRLTDSRLTSDYFHAFCQTSLVRWQLDQQTGGGGVPFLGSEYARRIRVPLPPGGVQESVVKMLRKAEERRIASEEKARSLLQSVDDVLLDELGILRKSEPIENRIFRAQFSNVTGQRWDPLFHQGDVFDFVRGAKCDLPKLGEMAAYFLTGFAAGRGDQSDEGDGIIQIRPTNLSDERELIFRRNVYIAANELKTRKADLLKPGEVLFNNTNSQEQVGKTAYFNLDGNYFSSNHITRIAAKTSRLNAQYLCYVLNLYQRQKVFFKLCTNWNNQSGVGTDILQRIPIPVPVSTAQKDTLTRQAEIVARLEDVRDQARKLRRQANEELEKSKREIETLTLGREGVQ